MKLTVTPNNTGTCKMRTVHLIAVKLMTLIGVCVCASIGTMEPLQSRHHRDPGVCPVKRGVPNSEVDWYTALCGWDCKQCPP